MVDTNESAPVEETPENLYANKVRRSIFIPEELEASLARLAEKRGTTTNDLICDILTHAVEGSEGTAGEHSH
jgi:hypothetical protein